MVSADQSDSMFVTYATGDRLLEAERLWEVVEEARTRWGSRTYRARELGGDTARWVTPRRLGRPATLVDRAAIRTFVERFYGAVERDPVLGPVFEQRIHGVWGPHLDTMVRFWSAVLLREPGYSGAPPVVHRAIEELSSAHFARWLELFNATLAEVFEPAAAESVAMRARQIARGLSTAVLGAPWDSVT